MSAQKRPQVATGSPTQPVVDLTADDDDVEPSPSPDKKKRRTSATRAKGYYDDAVGRTSRTEVFYAAAHTTTSSSDSGP